MNDEKFHETIEYLEGIAKEYPEFKTETYYSMMSSALKLKSTELFYKFFNEILEENEGYSEFLLRKSPSFGDIQGKEEFERLLKISVDNFEFYKKEKFKKHITEYPVENYNGKIPLALVLHGASSVLDHEYDEWKFVLDQGFILGMPAAPNEYWTGISTGYWNYDTAPDLISEYIDKLAEKNSIDFDNTIVGGLSQGGGLAIMMALTGKVKCKGFLVVSPGGYFHDNVDGWKEVIDNAKNKDLKGVIIYGDQDQAIKREYIDRLVELLNEGGISTELKEYQELGHWYPSNLSDIFKNI